MVTEKTHSDRRQLAPKIWAEIQAKYERGEKVIDLADEYGVSRGTIWRRSKKEGWMPQGSIPNEAIKEVREKVTEDFKSDLLENFERDNKLYSNLRQGILKAAAEELHMILAEQAHEKRIRAEAAEILEIPEESRTPEQKAVLRMAQKFRGNKRRAYALQALANVINTTINDDRETKGYTDIKPDREDDRLDAFYASWDEARAEIGIIDAPIGG